MIKLRTDLTIEGRSTVAVFLKTTFISRHLITNTTTSVVYVYILVFMESEVSRSPIIKTSDVTTREIFITATPQACKYQQID